MIRKLTHTEPVPIDLLLLADPSREMIDSYIKNGICYVTESDSKITGTYVLFPKTPETIELKNVAVTENHQNKGIGKRLILHAIQTAKDLGYSTIEVGTGNSSLNQLALYQKCGFRITGIEKDFFLRNYEEPIYENGIQCFDKILLSQKLSC